MNAKAIIDMFMRLFLRKIMSRGIDAVINLFARRGSNKAKGEPLSEEEQARARKARDVAEKARESARLARRIGRF